jgi:transcriptional regulator with XRE-family HTH domain
MGRKKTDNPEVDSVRDELARVATESGLTQQEIGEKMGFDPKDGRKAVSRLLNRKVAYDPRLSTVLRFAKAVGVHPGSLFVTRANEKPPAK